MDLIKKKTRIRLLAVFAAAALFLPVLFAREVFAAETFWCVECGAEMQYTDVTNTYVHPTNDCSHSGGSTNIPLNQDWLTNTQSEGGTGGDSTGDGTDESGEEAFGEGFIRMMLEKIFNSNQQAEGSFISPGNMLTETFNYLAGSGGVIDSITGSTWYLFLVGSCFMVMLIRFMSDFALDKAWDPSQQQTPEMFYKPLFKLIAAMIFVIALPYFLKFGMYISQAAIELIKNNPFSSNGTDTSEILKKAQDTLIDSLGFEAGGITKIPQNLGALIQGVIMLILPYIISTVCEIGVFFVIFSRILELSIRAALAPLAMTDIYKMGDRSHGMSYLFDFFGVCFQGFAILLVFFVADYITALLMTELLAEFESLLSTPANLGTICMCMAAINLGKLSIIFKTGSLAKSALSGGA